MMINNSQKIKKVLIISGFGLCGESATDITLRSYFSNWPKDKLMIITYANCERYFARTININTILNALLRSLVNKKLVKSETKTNNRKLIPGNIINDKTNRLTVKQKIFLIGAAYLDCLMHSYSALPHKQIRDFSPDVLYTIMGNIRINRLSYKISRRYNIRIIPHFMDDWISTQYKGNFLLLPPRLALCSSLNRLLSRSDFGFCISEKMCEEYRDKFKMDFISLMNIVDVGSIHILDKPINNSNKEIVFTYFGGLHLNRWKSLSIIENTIPSISKIIKNKIVLNIYTSDENIQLYSDRFDNKITRLCRSINHDLVIEKMRQSDLLIHVESFEPSIISFTRLSISTKLPEYFASGTPIFALGPKHIASIEYLQENECAYLATKNDPLTIEQVLIKAMEGRNNELYATNSRTLLLKNHSDKKLNYFVRKLSI